MAAAATPPCTSSTKPLAAVAALQLYERGKLLIDDPLAKYFPKFADAQVAELNASGDAITATAPAVRPITLRHLMMHTSGLVYGGRGNTAVHKLYQASCRRRRAAALRARQAFDRRSAGEVFSKVRRRAGRRTQRERRCDHRHGAGGAADHTAPSDDAHVRPGLWRPRQHRRAQALPSLLPPSPRCSSTSAASF